MCHIGGKLGGNLLQHDGEAAGLFKQKRVLLEPCGLLLLLRPYDVGSELVD